MKLATGKFSLSLMLETWKKYYIFVSILFPLFSTSQNSIYLFRNRFTHENGKRALKIWRKKNGWIEYEPQKTWIIFFHKPHK